MKLSFKNDQTMKIAMFLHFFLLMKYEQRNDSTSPKLIFNEKAAHKLQENYLFSKIRDTKLVKIEKKKIYFQLLGFFKRPPTIRSK